MFGLLTAFFHHHTRSAWSRNQESIRRKLCWLQFATNLHGMWEVYGPLHGTKFLTGKWFPVVCDILCHALGGLTHRARTKWSPLDRLQFNSLAPGRFQFNFRWVIFKLTLVNGGWGISYEIALRWMPLELTDEKSTLVQVMAWCHRATSHYLSQCWPRSMSPNGVTRPQWVKIKLLGRKYMYFLIKHQRVTLHWTVIFQSVLPCADIRLSPTNANGF